MTSGYSKEHITYPTALGGVETQTSRPEQPWDHPSLTPWHPGTHLLASLMSAMAMRILFRRKMSSKMIITSRMLRMITAGGAESDQVRHLPGLPTATQASLNGELGLTEGHPGLPQVQVHAEVRMEAKVHQGDVRAGLATQSSVLHVAMKYSCVGNHRAMTDLSPPTAPPTLQSMYNHTHLTETKTKAERGCHRLLLPQGLYLLFLLPGSVSPQLDPHILSSLLKCHLLMRPSGISSLI